MEPALDSPRTQPAPSRPALRLVQGRAAGHGVAAGRAWLASFTALAFSGGHGVFLFTALTRLGKVPSRVEVGSGLQLGAIGWFVAAAPLALLWLALRGRMERLSSGAAWAVATPVVAVTVVAFAFYLRGVALA